MAGSGQGFEYILVDLAAMRSLSKRLRSDGDKLKSYIESLEECIRNLGKDWEDENYAHFVVYFAERYSRMDHYGEFPQDQADWLDKAIPEYESLPDDITSRTDKILEDVFL